MEIPHDDVGFAQRTSGEGKSVEAGSVELEDPLEVTLRSSNSTSQD